MDYVLSKELEGTGFVGEILVDVPNLLERLKLIQAATTKDGDVLDNLGEAIKAVEMSIQRTKSVNVVHSSGKEIKSIDELMNYKDGSNVIYKIGAVIMNGVALGNG